MDITTPVELTVAICTYNGRDRLPEVLDALTQQEGTEGFTWEVLVIDNNSQDGTPELLNQYQQDWRQRAPANSRLRWLREPRQGTAFARFCAVRHAASREWVGFLDDDNIPARNWVKEAREFGRDRPHVGAYGGIIHAKLDRNPPDYFPAVKLLLAVYNRGDTPFCYARDRKPRLVPAAPGSVVRKQAWNDCVPPQLRLQGRDERGKTYLGACEDLETLFYIQNSHWQIWHNPNMEVWHHLPPHRLQREYLLKVARTSGLSNHALRIARLGNLAIALTPLYFLSDGYKLAAYYWKHRHHLSDDVPKACELQSRLGRFLSPFYTPLF